MFVIFHQQIGIFQGLFNLKRKITLHILFMIVLVYVSKFDGS